MLLLLLLLVGRGLRPWLLSPLLTWKDALGLRGLGPEPHAVGSVLVGKHLVKVLPLRRGEVLGHACECKDRGEEVDLIPSISRARHVVALKLLLDKEEA